MSEIKPALTPEEWATPEIVTAIGKIHSRPDADLPELRHAMAAYVLNGTPFGFTWDDVDLLREIAVDERGTPERADVAEEKLADLADRIAALLPPRETP